VAVDPIDPIDPIKEENTMNKRIVTAFFILLLVLTACGSKPASVAPVEQYTAGSRDMPASENLALPTAPSPLVSDASKGSGEGYANSAALQERLVIMNADLTIVVSDPQAKVDEISQMAANLGGFVISMNMYQTSTPSGGTAPAGSISIRVPADKLDSALDQIKADAVEVRNEDRSGQDVTSQYVDLQSQLTNLEKAEADLQAIMDEAKNNPNSNTSSKTQDVLQVYNQIISVRGQIESIKGQMQYFEQSSAYSLINATLIAEETIQPIEIGGWKPQGVARNAIQSLIKFWQGFVNFVITLVLLVLPVLITIFGPLALLAWGIVALIRRFRRKKTQSSK
jgi:hypothetical protein